MEFVRVTLQCAACGGTKDVGASHYPDLGYEFAQTCDYAGWPYLLDRYKGKIYAFCCDEHRDAQITKEGAVRKRIKKMARTEQAGESQ